jgi:type IV pilus biogenesis protein PilP
MPSEIRNRLARIPKRTKIIWGIFIALCLGYGIFGYGVYAVFEVFGQDNETPLAAKKKEQVPGPGKPTPGEKQSVPGEGQSVERERLGSPAAQVVLVEPEVVTGGNLSERMTLRADIELLELQVKKKELMDKLQPPVSAPAVPVTGPGLLELPPVGEVAPRPVSLPVPATVVVAVQGVNDGLSAVIRTKGKLVTVRKGQSFDGGIIVNISRSSVVVRRGDKTSVLPFE